MSRFGNLYAHYYDLLYKDKDYEGEVEYVESLIRAHHKNPKKLLDIGCGTGRHTELFCKRGFEVHGVDASAEMLEVAHQRASKYQGKLSLSCSMVQDLNLGTKFDVAVALFHVMSYQNTNTELFEAFQKVKNHLNNGGIFIFDFWYGPAVLTDLPTTRVKRLEDSHVKITRIAESTMVAMKNLVRVHYDIFIEDKKNATLTRKDELHSMRYFFDTELEAVCEQVGFKVEQKCEWLMGGVSFNSWNVVWVVKI